MSVEPVVAAKALTKRYGAQLAVDGLDLSIDKGEVFGLLGPNGAGKTTTILMLLGLTEPTSGQARIAGFDPLRQPLEVKRRAGYMPDQLGFYDHLSAVENLAYTARLAGIVAADADRRIAEALRRVRLADVGTKRVATYSRGMRQRLGLAEILVKGAEIAILDEPTSGLDPQSTQELLDLIRELASEGVTIVLSSHLLSMMQTICHRVALFRRGKIGLIGKVADLTADVLGGTHVVEVEASGVDVAAVLGDAPSIGAITLLGADRWRVDADADIRADIARRVVYAGGALSQMSIRHSTLDEVYVRFFEGENHDVAA